LIEQHIGEVVALENFEKARPRVAGILDLVSGNQTCGLHHKLPFPSGDGDAEQAAPAVDCITVQHDLAKVCLFAPALAELAAPPPVRHHPERPTATITELAGPHCARRRGARIFPADHDALARSFSTVMASLE
jgi:hypothetical protein